MKKNSLILATLLFTASAWAQGELDAFRMSTPDLQGTARGQAMGGAFGALGGDVTGISINPAGLGLYNSSEISASLAFSSVGIKSPTLTDNKSKINFDNISYVGNYQLNGEQKLNFGFSFNRLKNFDRRYSATSNGKPLSLTDFIAGSTNNFDGGYGIPEGELKTAYYDEGLPWLSMLGYDCGLIKPTIAGGSQYNSLLDNGERVQSRLSIAERGYVESYDLSLSTNVSNKLYLGLTFAITNMFYHVESAYQEDFDHGGGFYLDNYLETQGTGYQVKAGAIWHPVDWLRLGVAYHSPTIYTLDDYYQGIMRADGNEETSKTPNDGHTAYQFHTPQSWIFSAAGILGSQAIISLDYELKNYAQMRLYDQNGISLETDNQFIKEDAKAASTLRAGLEYRFTPQFSGRLGLAYLQNPYEQGFKDGREAVIVGTVPHYTLEGNTTYLTAGIGYKFTPSTYLDAAVVYKTRTDDLYYYPGADPVELKNNTTKAIVTVGYKF